MPAPSLPEPPARKVDWEVAKRTLAAVSEAAPIILQQGVIIGGIACWFYRQLLAKAQDPEFKVPTFSAVQSELWLSKDLDFTNFFSQDARDLLREHVIRDKAGRQHIVIAGVPIGFAQVGVTFDPESAYLDSWVGSFNQDERPIEFRVLNPISLYREKLALTQKRRAAADSVHLPVVAEFLRYETWRQIPALMNANTLSDRSTSLSFLVAMRDRAPEVCQDSRLVRRISAQLATATTLTPAEQDVLREILALAPPSG